MPSKLQAYSEGRDSLDVSKSWHVLFVLGT